MALSKANVFDMLPPEMLSLIWNNLNFKDLYAFHKANIIDMHAVEYELVKRINWYELYTLTLYPSVSYNLYQTYLTQMDQLTMDKLFARVKYYKSCYRKSEGAIKSFHKNMRYCSTCHDYKQIGKYLKCTDGQHTSQLA
jgi:hypothetical protein